MRVMLPRWAVIKDARRRQRRRLRRRVLVLVALAATGAGLLTGRSDAGLPNRTDPAAAYLGAAEVSGFGGYVLAAQASGDRLWAMTCVRLCGTGGTGLDEERLVELDARSGAVIRRLPALTNVDAFTTAGAGVWVAHVLTGDVTRLNPVTGAVTANVRLRLPRPVARHDREFLPENLSYADGYVWVSTARPWIAQIDARTGRLVRMLRTPSEQNATTSNRYGTWVAEGLDGIGRLAPRASRLGIHTVMQAGLPLDVYDVLGGGHTLWALAAPDTTSVKASAVVLAIDPRTARVVHRVHVPVAAGTVAVAAAGALYLANLARGRIYRVNRDGGLQTFRTPRHLAWLATSSPGVLWAAANVTPGQTQGRLLRIRLPGA